MTAIEHGEPSSVLCEGLEGWVAGGEGVREDWDTRVHMADSLPHAGETNRTL